MFLLLLAGCPTADSPAEDSGGWLPGVASNLCGTILRPDQAPAETSIWVATVTKGETACEGGGDTGGTVWWDKVVAEPAAVGDHFEATIPVGTYGVEITAGMYSGCIGARVLSEVTCDADVLVELGYMVP